MPVSLLSRNTNLNSVHFKINVIVVNKWSTNITLLSVAEIVQRLHEEVLHQFRGPRCSRGWTRGPRYQRLSGTNRFWILSGKFELKSLGIKFYVSLGQRQLFSWSYYFLLFIF